MTEQANDNRAFDNGGRTAGADPHGQAAMLLVESLIHGLIARSVITVEDAVEIVQTAAEVKVEIADHYGEPPEALRTSLDLLNSISISLSPDLNQGDGGQRNF